MNILPSIQTISAHFKKIHFHKIFISSTLLLSTSLLLFISQASATPNDSQSKTDTNKQTNNTATLIVAGGCFWCVESDFDHYPGVIDVVSGYIGGHTDNPTYKEVTYKNTGHYEAAKITFDPKKTSIEQLTEYFWKTIDPIDPHGQFCDKGHSYKSALFYQDDNQKVIFEKSLEQLKKNKPFAGDITTVIQPATKFYLAEGYHQDYKKKNPLRYYYYRTGCGRDGRIKQLWGEVASKNFSAKK